MITAREYAKGDGLVLLRMHDAGLQFGVTAPPMNPRWSTTHFAPWSEWQEPEWRAKLREYRRWLTVAGAARRRNSGDAAVPTTVCTSRRCGIAGHASARTLRERCADAGRHRREAVRFDGVTPPSGSSSGGIRASRYRPGSKNTSISDAALIAPPGQWERPTVMLLYRQRRAWPL